MKSNTKIQWLDNFSKTMLCIMIGILMCIFAAGKYMDAHKMEAGGTDDKVNNLATQVTKGDHHPFIDLPGDAQVGAFSVANLFVGLVIGHEWEKLFGKSKRKEEESSEVK
ncbi:hypothetical protein ACETAC_10940 [Aceticella autotrophica]|uniref:Cobalt/nickel transport protein n=1 Tax=Aceticella autotrophica TaxID=2755338 RepID=A0A975AVQ3_9THEO|nr:hypothetical protein [Aceticella autotrophica]QSZ27329.1 hypothetical protein ACETAC_10940 [Aceticella autotrophica]